MDDRRAKISAKFGAVIAWGGAFLLAIGALRVETNPVLIAGAVCLTLTATILRSGPRARANESTTRVVVVRLLRSSGEQLPLIVVGTGLVIASQLHTNVNLLVVVGAILLAVAAGIRGRPPALRGRPRVSDVVRDCAELINKAHELLDHLGHEKTVTRTETSWVDGSVGRLLLKLRLALSLGTTTGLTDRVPEYPETMEHLEQFIRDAIGLDVWIGIDLGRMHCEEALKFLADIQPVLAIKRERCFVLVSVRGDGSDQRLTDAFDRVVRLKPLDFTETRALLSRQARGDSVPFPFVALCHVLSDGTPAELEICAQQLVDSKPRSRVRRLSDLALALTNLQLEEHLDDLQQKALLLPRSHSQGRFLDWVHELRISPSSRSPAALLELHAKPAALYDGRQQGDQGRATAADDPIAGLADELAAHCYFAATVLAFFDEDHLTPDAVDRVLSDDAYLLGELRHARSMLSRSPGHASRVVRSFRERCDIKPIEPAPRA